MDLTNELILIASLAFLVSILASLVGQRLGMPVLLVSLVGQGWTIPALARWLKLEMPPRTQVVERLEIDLPGERELELVGY